MKPDPRVFSHLARIFSYPDAETLTHLERLEELLEGQHERLNRLSRFADLIRLNGIRLLEEVFTQAFDLSTTNCLEVGWHLYGEDYKRGQFLVRMRAALAEKGIAESLELPDHLSHCLQLLSRLDDEDSEIFVGHFLQPAITRIVKGLPEENVYRGPIKLLYELLAEWAETEADLRTDPATQSSFELPVLNGSC